ncbi:MAG: hypothetical protein RH859_07180 [Longimicrobiales bacterium]
MTDRRAGLALVGAVAVLVAATLLAHAALLLALFETAAGRAGLDLLRARTAAASALASLDAVPSGDSVPVGGWIGGPEVSSATGAAATRFDRLSHEVWLVRARGRAVGGPARAHDARLLWHLDPVTRVAAFRAVVEVGPDAPTRGAVRVDGAGFTRTGPPVGAPACRELRPRLASSMPTTMAPLGAHVADTVLVPGLGPLTGADLAAGLPLLVEPRGTPAPMVAGTRCVDGAWNWGDPDVDGGPCAARFVAARAAADLVVSGGTGQGLLVVPSDLTFAGGARFYGVVLVGGALRLQDGSELIGVARARRGLVVDASSRVVGAACRAVLALDRLAPMIRVLPGGAHLAPLDAGPP